MLQRNLTLEVENLEHLIENIDQTLGFDGKNSEKKNVRDVIQFVLKIKLT